ncbi:sensor histidine kinase [Candidatus Micrarchaeota archaeon]|nr:sensor histidine kinase [Candidatus Micrarchaeota archaeon]
MAESKIPNELSFSITARTALLLGRENISSSTVAVLELVRNAYDADATEITIRFRKANTTDGTIEIIDNGHGMNWGDIITKWMVIGTNNKQISPYSPKGRRKVGEKGIGRFALDRLSSQTTLETTSRLKSSEPTYRLEINWDKFVNTPKSLQQIKHPIKVIARYQKTGTRILMKGLRDIWTRKDYETLYKNLVVLIPPFEKKLAGFSIIFDCDETPDLSGRVRSPLTEVALFKMKCDLSKDGKAKIVITTRDGSDNKKFRRFKNYRRTWKQLLDSPSGKPVCGSLHFEFYWYLREAPAKSLGISLKQLQDYLEIYGGVRIYRDGFRVKPYGDPGGGGDWLGLNARRVRNPGGVRSKERWVVGENQVAAGVFISSDENPGLKDQTNREGLISNQAFEDMLLFVTKCIDYFETDRQAYERNKKVPEEPETLEQSIQLLKEKYAKDVKNLDDAIDTLSNEKEKQILKEMLQGIISAQEKNVDALAATYDTEQIELISKMQLLQNMATIGIAIASMGHEVLETSRHLLDAVNRIAKRVKELMLLTDEKMEKYLVKLEKQGGTLYSIASFALGHANRDKRTRQKFNPTQIIDNLYNETLLDLCATNSVEVNFFSGNVPDIYAFPYEIESIVMNFVTNSISAFNKRSDTTEAKKIEIETRYSETNRMLEIVASDNGPGIPEGDEKRIFEVYSTKIDKQGKPVGTGIGLVIVKDIVDSHKGKIKVVAHGKRLGGAEFTVSLPVPKERGKKREIK